MFAILDADERFVLLHAGHEPTAGGGVLVDPLDLAFQLQVGESVQADGGVKARFDPGDLGFVHLGLDLHLLGVGQLDDHLALADRSPFFDDDFASTATVGDVGIDHLARLRRPNDTVGNLCVHLLKLLQIELVAVLGGIVLGFGRLDVGVELEEHLGLAVVVEHLQGRVGFV